MIKEKKEVKYYYPSLCGIFTKKEAETKEKKDKTNINISKNKSINNIKNK